MKSLEITASRWANDDEDEEDESDSIDAPNKEQMPEDNAGSSDTGSDARQRACNDGNGGDAYGAERSEDNAESSSTASDGGKGTGSGSGSGGGYSADFECSSSDASSGGAAPEDDMKRLKVTGGEHEEKSTRAARVSKKSSAGKHAGSKIESKKESSQKSIDGSNLNPDGSLVVGNSASFPQWNGVRILHPMDPRIDLSTVGHIQTSSLSAFPSNVQVSSSTNNTGTDEALSVMGSNQETTPSIDQYMSLMEVVRPFFHAHGISHSQSLGLEDSSERHLSELADGASDFERKPTPSTKTVEMHVDHGEGPSDDSDGPSANNESSESDSSSMVVLARVKRKHLRHQAKDEGALEELNNSSNGDSNSSSSSSSDKRVRIQHANINVHEGGFRHEGESPAVENGGNGNEPEDDAALPDEDGTDRQESTSASSSATGNNIQAEQGDPLGFGVPAVVSEYSSSRAGSSGASNNNQMSTSGSGSAGNTGSGTASGSNQGGSSGSGNDQGGISSNGNGSSASGNDVKGSSEETMDNSGENNSGEGNSDATNSNKKRKCNTSTNAAIDPPHASAHRYHANAGEGHVKDLGSPVQLHRSKNSNAVREKKLLDKKRKRMNMRREYEEKVQQEMESSEGSRDRDENALIKPGRPVTLDKVLSFTKTARIVCSATPPFVVIHTNAAFCRLSNIDSHTVVGKPISNILSIPDPQTLAAVKDDHERQKTDDAAALSGGGAMCDNRDGGKEDLLHPESNEAQGLTAAEAAGRAQAAASQEDSVERLIATNGFGRWNIINLNAKPQSLLGQKFAIPKLSPSVPIRNREEGSNVSSIASTCDAPYRHVPCSMGVSPVVSSPEAFTVVTDKDQESHHHKSKRRKHHQNDAASSTSTHHHQQPRRTFPHREVSLHRKRHLITHYLIQLEPFESGNRKLGSLESQSSTSTTFEAQLLGMTKSELRLQRGRDLDSATLPGHDPAVHEESDEEAMDSESSNPHEAVTAVG